VENIKMDMDEFEDHGGFFDNHSSSTAGLKQTTDQNGRLRYQLPTGCSLSCLLLQRTA
jgi:hypothetical protein